MKRPRELMFIVLTTGILYSSLVVAHDLIKNGLNPHESSVVINAHVDPYIHGRVNHTIDVYGRHNIAITNNSQEYKNYTYTLEVCVETFCVNNNKSKTITIAPGDSFHLNDNTLKQVKFERAAHGWNIHASTTIVSEGERSWTAVGDGKMDIDW